MQVGGNAASSTLSVGADPMRIHSIILSIAIAAVPATSFAQTLVEPQTLPPNFGEAPASRVSDPTLPRNAVRQLVAQAAKAKAESAVLPQDRPFPQNKQLAMVTPGTAPQVQKSAALVRPAAPPPPPAAQSFAPRRNPSINPEIEVSERVTYSQEGDLVRMKVVRDFKVDGQIIRSESAEVLGKPGRSGASRSSGKRGKSNGNDFAPRSDFDPSQTKESEGPLY
jgi:hypothetical protein